MLGTHSGVPLRGCCCPRWPGRPRVGGACCPSRVSRTGTRIRCGPRSAALASIRATSSSYSTTWTRRAGAAGQQPLGRGVAHPTGERSQRRASREGTPRRRRSRARWDRRGRGVCGFSTGQMKRSPTPGPRPSLPPDPERAAASGRATRGTRGRAASRRRGCSAGRENARQPAGCGPVVVRRVLLRDQDLVASAVPAPGPVLVGPAEAEREVGLAGRQHLVERALEQPPAAEPVVVVAEAVDAVARAPARPAPRGPPAAAGRRSRGRRAGAAGGGPGTAAGPRTTLVHSVNPSPHHASFSGIGWNCGR